MNQIEKFNQNEGVKIESEEDIRPESIAIATSTFYPKYGEEDSKSVDNVRGNLALKSFTEAKAAGYVLVVVDGGSSTRWKDELEVMRDQNFIVEEQEEPGLSASRRQAMRTASNIPGVLVVGETEPEKTDVIEQAKKLALPIISGEAVVVVPDRGEAGMQNYPEIQKKAEARGNLLANSMMKERGIMPAGNDLDWWIGVRFIKNSPEVLDDFLQKREMRGKSKLFKISRPGDWSDAMFTPLVDSLRKYKEKVKSVPISYSHPLEMTEIEEKDPVFDRKRAVQLRSIITNLVEKVREVEGDEKKSTRLVDVKSKDN